MKCYKCNEEMTHTPVCCNCGRIPLTEHSDLLFKQKFEELEKENQRLRERCESMTKEINDLNKCIDHFKNSYLTIG